MKDKLDKYYELVKTTEHYLYVMRMLQYTYKLYYEKDIINDKTYKIAMLVCKLAYANANKLKIALTNDIIQKIDQQEVSNADKIQD